MANARIVASIVAVIASILWRTPLLAQQADVIRGRMTSDDGQPVDGAAVQATSIPNNVARTTRTDRGGRFGLTFAGGDGDYWITVSALGFAQKRFELKRIADEEILIADAKLHAPRSMLEAVRVKGDRDAPGRNDNSPDASGTEKIGRRHGVDPKPGRQSRGDGRLAAGRPAHSRRRRQSRPVLRVRARRRSEQQHAQRLQLRRRRCAARRRDPSVARTTSPWDVSRGGFSGGQFSTAHASGLELQLARCEQPARPHRSSSGPIAPVDRRRASSRRCRSVRRQPVRSRWIGRSTTSATSSTAGSRDLQNLTTANALALQTAGVARDSVERLRRSSASAASRPPSGDFRQTVRTIAAVPRHARLLAVVVDERAVAQHHGDRNVQSLLVAVRPGDVAPDERRAQHELVRDDRRRATRTTSTPACSPRRRSAFRDRASSTDPYLAMPSGNVRVGSVLDDGSSAISQLRSAAARRRARATRHSASARRINCRGSRSTTSIASSSRASCDGMSFAAGSDDEPARHVLVQLARRPRERARRRRSRGLLSPRLRAGESGDRRVVVRRCVPTTPRPAGPVRRARRRQSVSRPHRRENTDLATTFGVDNDVTCRIACT